MHRQAEQEQAEQATRTQAAEAKPADLRGAALEIQSARAREVAIEGPAGTGKSFGVLYKVNQCAARYAHARLLIVRQTRESLTESALVTLERDVLGYESPITQGPQRRDRHSYRYPNGSEIIISGLRQSGKDVRQKVMSTDYDLIYVQEAPEILEDDYQKLTTRLRNNRMPYQQIILDLNPDIPLHWIYRREASGRLKLFKSFHEDNPLLWDAVHKDWTPQGANYRETLSELTGVLRDRYFLGLRAMSSGLVFGDVWSDGPIDGNVTEKAEFTPDGGPIYWALDDGYAGEYDAKLGNFTAESHPRAFLLCQLQNSGILKVFAESYAVKRLSDAHLEDVLALPYPRPDFVGLGNDAAEMRGRLHAHGLPTMAGPKSVEESVKVMRDWIGADPNKVREVLVHPRCKIFKIEMVSWKHDEGEPWKDTYGHGPAALRYLIWALRHNQ